MGQTSKELLQSRAHEMVACLEFIKLNIKTDGESGKMANGKRKLEMWRYYLNRFFVIPVNYAFWIFILYKLLF